MIPCVGKRYDQPWPAYVPTDEDRRVVEMMAGWAIPEAKIAKVLTIDPKNLCKHFAMELDVGHARLEAQLAQNLIRIAQGHDRQSLIASIFALKSRFGWIEQQPPAREQPLGKKETRMEAAQRAVSGNSNSLRPGQHRAIARTGRPMKR